MTSQHSLRSAMSYNFPAIHLHYPEPPWWQPNPRSSFPLKFLLVFKFCVCLCLQRHSLSETVPRRLMYLNIWVPVGATIWEDLEHMDLLEEVWYLGWALRVKSLTLLLVCYLCFVLVVHNVKS